MTDKNEKRRWPSVPRSVYPEFSREDFFYREDKRSMTLSEVVVFLESKKAVYASDYSRLQKEEPLLPPRRKIFNGGKIKCSDELFRFRSNDSLIKVANLYYYNLKEFRRFLRLNAVVGQKEYLKFKRGLPLEERKFFPQRPKEIYLRFYGDLDGVGAETNFYRLWGEFGSAAEMSISVRALGIKDQQSLRKMSQTIPALSVDPRVFEDWPGKMLGYTEDEAWEIFFNVYDPYKDCSKGDGCVDDLENDIDPELASVEISEDFNDDDISRMLASIGDSVISFDD